MMKLLRLFSFATVLLVLAGCSKSEQKPTAPAGTAAPRTEFKDISDVPAELRADLEAFGKQFESDCREGDTNALRRTFDPNAITDMAFDGVQADEARLEKFKGGFKDGVFKSTAQLAAGWAQGDAKYKGLVLYKGNPAARFRLVVDEAGITMVDLVLQRSAQGKVRIVNFCNHAMGYEMVEQSRQMMAPMITEMDKGFLERLVNRPNSSHNDMKQFGDLTKSFARRDFAGTVRVYEGLPPALKETMAATAMYLAGLQNLGDDNKYKRALKEAGARFKSASFQFMLVDAYFLDKEYDKAIECIDNFMQALEKDAALLALKSLMMNAKGDVKGAQTVLQEAFKLEPDCAFAHIKGLDVLLAAKNFTGVRDSMVFLEEKEGYNFKGAMEDPLWDEFKKAPEAKRWR